MISIVFEETGRVQVTKELHNSFIVHTFFELFWTFYQQNIEEDQNKLSQPRHTQTHTTKQPSPKHSQWKLYSFMFYEDKELTYNYLFNL